MMKYTTKLAVYLKVGTAFTTQKQLIVCLKSMCLFVFMLYIRVNNFSVMSGPLRYLGQNFFYQLIYGIFFSGGGGGGIFMPFFKLIYPEQTVKTSKVNQQSLLNL